MQASLTHTLTPPQPPLCHAPVQVPQVLAAAPAPSMGWATLTTWGPPLGRSPTSLIAGGLISVHGVVSSLCVWLLRKRRTRVPGVMGPATSSTMQLTHMTSTPPTGNLAA